jgi:hypothetical protein
LHVYREQTDPGAVHETPGRLQRGKKPDIPTRSNKDSVGGSDPKHERESLMLAYDRRTQTVGGTRDFPQYSFRYGSRLAHIFLITIDLAVAPVYIKTSDV